MGWVGVVLAVVAWIFVGRAVLAVVAWIYATRSDGVDFRRLW
jgi:hypothetical protein